MDAFFPSSPVEGGSDDTPISEIIRRRVEEAERRYFANDTIYEFILNEDEREALLAEVEGHVQNMLRSLVIDIENDHNTRETARRVAKMYVNEVFRGRYHRPPTMTEFPNAGHLDELFTLGPISVRSACSHHLVPIIGRAWIGIMPSDKVIGISKFNRIVDWVMSRPHIQEEAAIMVADEIENAVKPLGLAVVIEATHHCMHWRGVKDNGTMINSIVRGVIRENKDLKTEFFTLIRAQGFAG